MLKESLARSTQQTQQTQKPPPSATTLKQTEYEDAKSSSPQNESQITPSVAPLKQTEYEASQQATAQEGKKYDFSYPGFMNVSGAGGIGTDPETIQDKSLNTVPLTERILNFVSGAAERVSGTGNTMKAGVIPGFMFLGLNPNEDVTPKTIIKRGGEFAAGVVGSVESIWAPTVPSASGAAFELAAKGVSSATGANVDLGTYSTNFLSSHPSYAMGSVVGEAIQFIAGAKIFSPAGNEAIGNVIGKMKYGEKAVKVESFVDAPVSTKTITTIEHAGGKIYEVTETTIESKLIPTPKREFFVVDDVLKEPKKITIKQGNPRWVPESSLYNVDAAIDDAPAKLIFEGDTMRASGKLDTFASDPKGFSKMVIDSGDNVKISIADEQIIGRKAIYTQVDVSVYPDEYTSKISAKPFDPTNTAISSKTKFQPFKNADPADVSDFVNPKSFNTFKSADPTNATIPKPNLGKSANIDMPSASSGGKMISSLERKLDLASGFPKERQYLFMKQNTYSAVIPKISFSRQGLLQRTDLDVRQRIDERPKPNDYPNAIQITTDDITGGSGGDGNGGGPRVDPITTLDEDTITYTGGGPKVIPKPRTDIYIEPRDDTITKTFTLPPMSPRLQRFDLPKRFNIMPRINDKMGRRYYVEDVNPWGSGLLIKELKRLGL